MHVYDVLRRPLITEKNTLLNQQNKYVFEVARNANKLQIKQAVETAFKVKVVAVNVINMPGKQRRFAGRVGRTSPWRKAIVTLAEGQRIEFFESP